MTARTVTGNTVLLTGSAQASQTVTFVKRYATISGVVITQSGSTTTTTDASGNFSKALDCPASGSTSWTLVTPDGSEFDFTLPYGDGSSVSVTTLISAPTVDADAVTLLLDGYEPDLGNPGTSGHVLSSTTAGVRSWVAQSGGGGASDVDDLTTATGEAGQYMRVDSVDAAGLEYRDPSQVLSDIGAETAGAAATVQSNLTTHTSDTSNPHSVTAAQVGASALRPTQTDIAGTTHTLTTANEDQIVTSQSGSATVFTVPLNSAQAFTVGAIVGVEQQGAGVLTITATAGVTLNGVDGASKAITGQWKAAAIRKVSTNGWVIIGAI